MIISDEVNPGIKIMKIKIGISGHRMIDSVLSTFVASEIKRILTEYDENGSEMIALSALAIGADSVFSHIALETGYSLVAILPFRGYEQDFQDEFSRDQFYRLLESAKEIIRLEPRSRSNEAYLNAGKYIVEQCDIMIFVWDGKPAAGKGGTGDIVAYAKKLKKHYFHIDTIEKKVKESVA